MKEQKEIVGMYFRVKRKGKWENIDLPDMTLQERLDMLEGKDRDWLIGAINSLAEWTYNNVRKEEKK